MRRSDRGSAVIETVFLMCLALLLVVAFANLIVDVLIKGVAHSAVDQGVRAGARQDADSVSACETRAHQVLSNILAGPAGAGATVSCSTDGDTVVAVVHLALSAWLPLVRDSVVDVTGKARKEGVR